MQDNYQYPSDPSLVGRVAILNALQPLLTDQDKVVRETRQKK